MPRMVFNWVLWRYTILYINERSWESGGVVRLALCVKCACEFFNILLPACSHAHMSCAFGVSCFV